MSTERVAAAAAVTRRTPGNRQPSAGDAARAQSGNLGSRKPETRKNRSRVLAGTGRGIADASGQPAQAHRQVAHLSRACTGPGNPRPISETPWPQPADHRVPAAASRPARPAIRAFAIRRAPLRSFAARTIRACARESSRCGRRATDRWRTADRSVQRCLITHQSRPASEQSIADDVREDVAVLRCKYIRRRRGLHAIALPTRFGAATACSMR